VDFINVVKYTDRNEKNYKTSTTSILPDNKRSMYIRVKKTHKKEGKVEAHSFQKKSSEKTKTMLLIRTS